MEKEFKRNVHQYTIDKEYRSISLTFRFSIFAIFFFPSLCAHVPLICLSPDTRYIVFFKDARNAIYHKTKKG